MRYPVDPAIDRDEFIRELVLLINALTYFVRMKVPRSIADRKAGRTIQPQSAMNTLLGANRVLKRNFHSFVPLKSVSLAVKGLMRKFILKFGPTSLVPKRREPFTNGMIKSMLALAGGVLLGAFGVLDWTSRAGLSLKAAFTLAVSAGFRKAELFESNEETAFMSWQLVSWSLKGKVTATPTRAQLLALSEGDYLVVSCPPSKADQLNTVWGPLPVYVAFHERTRNAAAAMRDLMLSVGPDNCRDGPVFTDSRGQALKATVMVDCMYHWVQQVVPKEAAKLYTWHSPRIYLACALSAQGVKDSTIQALLRWQTAESLRVYARLSMHTYGGLVDGAAEACVASVQTSNLPMFERFDLFLALNREVE